MQVKWHMKFWGNEFLIDLLWSAFIQHKTSCIITRVLRTPLRTTVSKKFGNRNVIAHIRRIEESRSLRSFDLQCWLQGVVWVARIYKLHFGSWLYFYRLNLLASKTNQYALPWSKPSPLKPVRYIYIFFKLAF